jgi:hypothetical protein
LISKILYKKKHARFYKSTCSLDELDEKPNHSKISKFWNFEKKGCKTKDSFFKPFDKKNMFNGFKMSSFRSKSHMKEINMPRNMFSCPLTLILRFFWDFLHFWHQTKILIHNYVWLWKITINTWIILYWTIQFSHLSLFHVNVICRK